MHTPTLPVSFAKDRGAGSFKIRKRLLLILAAAALTVGYSGSVLARQTPRELAAKGDKSWNEKSYSEAADSYIGALAADPSLPNRAEIELRILTARIKASQWDDAVKLSDAYQKRWRGTSFEAYGLIWREKLYTLIDHTGYRVGKQTFRGSDVPKSVEDSEPQPTNFDAADAKEVDAALASARTLLDRFRNSTADPAVKARLNSGTIDIDFDTIGTIFARHEAAETRADEDFDWSIKPSAPYDPRWPAPKRIMYLYAQIIDIDTSTAGSNHHNTVLARLGEATFILDCRQINRSNDRVIPYAAQDPIAMLEKTLQQYPDDADADRIAFLVAQWLDQKGDSGHAAQAYKSAIDRYPKGRWRSDAEKALTEILAPLLSVSVPQVAAPGQKLSISLTSRNITIVNFTAYRVHPEQWFGHTTTTDKYVHSPAFDDLNAFLSHPELIAAYRREKVAEWTATTSNNGLHNLPTDLVNTPLDTMGAYIIEATGDSPRAPHIESLAIISDIAIVQKVDRSSALVFVAEAKTGRPIGGAKLMVWAPRRAGADIDRDAQYISGSTDTTGVYRTDLPSSLDGPANDYHLQRIAQTFAMVGPNRYAVTARANMDTAQLPLGEKRYQVYITTDRPLYRPGQTIEYHAAVTVGDPSRYSLAAGKQIVLRLRSKSGELFSRTETTGTTGKVTGRFTLSPRSDLGSYTLTAEPIKSLKLADSDTYGKHEFRVEEYKKPEFSVTVVPDHADVHIGEKLPVTISASYFYGAPVANARVHYKVSRQSFNSPSPFITGESWYKLTADQSARGRRNSLPKLYVDDNDRSYSSYQDVVVLEGDAVTGPTGEARISISTAQPRLERGERADPEHSPDLAYSVVATVTDDSRREVEGVGSVRVGARLVNVAMRCDKQFVLTGETLKIDVNSQDANGKAVELDGNVTFWKQIPAIPAVKKRDERTGKMVIVSPFVPARQENQGSMPIRSGTEPGGTGSTYWHPTEAADYILIYEAHDAHGTIVRHRMPILVYGRSYDQRLQKGDQIFAAVAERATYEPGDVARVLIVTPAPDSWVLFTDTSVGAIRSARTVFVPGRSTLIEAPISQYHLPNASFAVSCISGGYVYDSSADVLVIARKRVLDITVTPDKPSYRPGEHAVFHIHAANASGTPVSGEVTIGVVDEALLAMEPDNTTDIRTFYYGNSLETAVAGATSYYFSPGQRITPSGPVIAFETHRLAYPEDMDWIDRPGGRQSSEMRDLPGYVEFDVDALVDDKKDVKLYKWRAQGIETDPAISAEVQKRKNEILHVARQGQHTGMNGLPGPGPANGTLETQLNFALTTGRGRYEKMGNLSSMDGAPPTSKAARSLVTKVLAAPMSGELAEARVRRTFSDTAYWMPAVTTDAKGNAKVEFDFPDNITSWRLTARAIDSNVNVGTVQALTVTKKGLLVRLQSPRFSVQGDDVTFTANLHNYLTEAKQARVELALDPAVFALAAGAATDGALVRSVTVARDGEARIDWHVRSLRSSISKIKVVAQTDTESDAAEVDFPVLVHGIEKLAEQSGTLHGGANAEITLDLPDMRRKGSSLLNIQLSPSLGATMLDALPYLEDYPYGCVEQTLSRFVPTMSVSKSLKEAGVDLESLGKRMTALEEQRRTIPLQQQYDQSGYTYPKGKPGVMPADLLAERLFLSGRSHAPIFDSAALTAMTQAGLAAIYDQQRDDGSWGWWKGSTVGDPYMSAYALEGLLRCKRLGVTLREDVLLTGMNYLDRHLDTTEEINLLAYYSYVLSLSEKAQPGTSRYIMADDTLYARREKLTPYGAALLALTLHAYGDDEKAGIVVRNLSTNAKVDAAAANVHWESSDAHSWLWYNDKLETTAAVLRAMTAIAPSSDLAAKSVKWLVDNRRSGHWTSTRQTALVIEALIEYAKSSGELAPDLSIQVDLDGRVQKTYKIDAGNALLFDGRFLVGDEMLASGAQKLHITVQGKGTLYWNSSLSYFDLSEPIAAQANAISVERKYYRVVRRVAGKNARKRTTTSNTLDAANGGDQDTDVQRIPLTDGGQVASGDIVEVELYIKSDNDYDHVVFEDMKPAGFEAVATRSGEAYGDGLCSNFELRDEKVAFFIDNLPQGTRRITYRLRAEVPGAFHALPTNGYAMYAPDIRATSGEGHLVIADAPLVRSDRKADRKKR